MVVENERNLGQALETKDAINSAWQILLYNLHILFTELSATSNDSHLSIFTMLSNLDNWSANCYRAFRPGWFRDYAKLRIGAVLGVFEDRKPIVSRQYFW